MNRRELQQLSDERIEDARALLAASRWAGAYYLAGYALECALKSCVLVYIDRTGIIFEDKRYGERCWTHNIEALVVQAGLDLDRDNALAANPNMEQNWLTANSWSEASRYHVSTQTQAEELFNALTDAADGVIPWVKNYW